MLYHVIDACGYGHGTYLTKWEAREEAARVGATHPSGILSPVAVRAEPLSEVPAHRLSRLARNAQPAVAIVCAELLSRMCIG